MDNNKLEYFKNLLKEEKKSRTDSLLADRLGMDESIRNITSELSNYDNHPADLGTETFEAEKNLSFRNNDKFVIQEIDNALNKIEKGNYGICEICGKDIIEDRLEIIPYARLCMECEKDFELKPGVDAENGRPIEEQILYPPFGRSFTDNSVEDEIMFDGEDAWQAVNEYNVRTSDNEYSQNDSFGYVEDVEQISNQQYKRQLE